MRVHQNLYFEKEIISHINRPFIKFIICLFVLF